MSALLKRSFFERSTLEVAPDLLGKEIIVKTKSSVKSGFIVEVEAYTENDPACHAACGMTPRNEVMFGSGGISYVYLIYGMYFCLNFVTEKKGIPGAVLIRALEISEYEDHRIASGPGKLCKYLGVNKTHNKIDATKNENLICVLNSKYKKNKFSITQTTRIGITKASHYPWRWYITDSNSVSKK